MSADDSRFAVLSPEGRTLIVESPSPRPVDDLRSAVVAELWNQDFKGDRMFRLIREQLSRHYPGIRFVGHETFGDIHGHVESRVVADLPGLLRAAGATAAIVAVGA